MKRSVFSLVLLLACGDSASVEEPRCSLADTGAPCSQGTTATLANGVWSVVLRTSVTDQIDYSDGGFVCTRQNRRCVQEECHFAGVPNWTQTQAIAECRKSFGR